MNNSNNRTVITIFQQPGAVGQAVIPAFWKAEEGGLQGQEFKISLANMVKYHLYQYKN